MQEPDTTETEYDCPRCGGEKLNYGKFADARLGIRGYSCPACEVIWTTDELKRKGVID